MDYPAGPFRAIFFPDTLLLDRKLEEHRRFAAGMSLLCAFTAAGLWGWDKVVDPLGARHTLGLRAALLPVFGLLALVLGRVQRRWLAVPLGCALVLLVEGLFVLILDRLHTGMTYGIGGFMFFFLVPLVLFQGFSLRVNLAYTFLAAALPQAYALAGLAHGFEHARYAVLIWPAAFCTGCAQAAFARNYQERYLSERRLEQASNTDALTGVSNRRHFMPILARERSRCRRFHHPLCLLMLDIDQFKRVNDTFGHPTGDQVIRKVAETCRSVSRGSDVVARLGGEEFAVLLPEASLAGALAYAERIREDVEALAVTAPGHREARCTVSIGVAASRPEDRTEEDLLQRADEALYRAKGTGRNRVCG